MWKNKELSYKELKAELKAMHGLESDESSESDEDTHIKDYHNYDFRPYNLYENYSDESTDSDYFYESVDSDNQLEMHEKHDDEFRPNEDRFDIEGTSRDLEEPAKEGDKKDWQYKKHWLESYRKMIPAEHFTSP